MKNNRIIIIFATILLIVIMGGFLVIRNLKRREEEGISKEYIPQEEITENQTRQTIVTLYFPSKDTNKLTPEARLIDIKEIINTPYDKLVNLLIEGPKGVKNKKSIPENTKLKQAYLENDCVVLDFSAELLRYAEEEIEKESLIKSIVNTLTELTEVNKVRFLIEGNQEEEFNEIYTR